MVSRKKINLEKVLAALNVTCPLCGYSIPPNEQMRVSNDRMRCRNAGRSLKRAAIKAR